MATPAAKADLGANPESIPTKATLVGLERSLRAATLFLSSVEDFRLCAATYGNPVRRDYWIARLRQNLAEKQTLLTVLDFAPMQTPRLLHGLRDHLRNEPTPSGWRRAVCVVGLEPHLPDATAPTGHSRKTNRFLTEANLDRELFPRDCPVPLVLWLTQTGIGSFSREAPDLWHWRSHVFDFEETEGVESGGQTQSIAQLESATAGTVYRNRAEMERAAAIFREGLKASLQAHGPDHPTTCRARLNLGNVLRQLGDYRQAVELFRENLAELEKRSDATSDDLVPTLASLGISLHGSGQYDEAEPYLRRALETNEKNHGKEHPNVASALSNLAQLLKDTNRLAEAEPLMRRALEIGEKGYGKEHPNVATTLNNLALLLKATKRLAEAESLMRRALEISEKSLGKEHPNVAIRLNNLALLLKATNRLAEAEPLMRRALKIGEKSLGKEHPDVATTLNNLALLLQATNRLAEAESLMRRGLEIDEKSFGKEHPSVAIRLNNLASLLQATNRLAEAEPLVRRALEILLLSTYRTGHRHSHLEMFTENYVFILKKLGWGQDRIDEHLEQLREGVKRPGFELGELKY